MKYTFSVTKIADFSGSEQLEQILMEMLQMLNTPLCSDVLMIPQSTVDQNIHIFIFW